MPMEVAIQLAAWRFGDPSERRKLSRWHQCASSPGFTDGTGTFLTLISTRWTLLLGMGRAGLLPAFIRLSFRTIAFILPPRFDFFEGIFKGLLGQGGFIVHLQVNPKTLGHAEKP